MLWFSLRDLYTIWTMYILGLSSFWGTSWICPAWSPCEHQLTLALSPIWGPRPKPRRPEEVVYSLNDSCSRFTQHLFPPKLPQQYMCTIFSIHLPSFILIIHHIYHHSYLLYITFNNIYILLLRDNHSVTSSIPLGRPTALGLLCPIQLPVVNGRGHLNML